MKHKDDRPVYWHGYKIPWYLKYLIDLHKYPSRPNHEIRIDKGGKVSKKYA